MYILSLDSELTRALGQNTLTAINRDIDDGHKQGNDIHRSYDFP
jgi:hypothetical protein